MYTATNYVSFLVFVVTKTVTEGRGESRGLGHVFSKISNSSLIVKSTNFN
jgi:hypothetical protein